MACANKSFFFLSFIKAYLEVGDSLANLLDLSGAFEAEDERSLGGRVDGALTHDQILEVQATGTNTVTLVFCQFYNMWRYFGNPWL